MDEQFGPFRLLAELGRGGMGETFVAEREGPAGFVQRLCVKRVLPMFLEDIRWILSFQREARMLALLNHPNIASVYDFGEENGRWWMSLELVEGADLRTVIRHARRTETRLPIDVVVHIAAELAKALAHAHSRTLPGGAPAKMVHRDVAPSNVLLSLDGAVKLGDFGLAKIADGEGTRSDIRKGKDPYISSEQVLAMPLDGRADLFALGVVIFEMLAGTRPFDGPTQMMTMKNVVEGNAKDLRPLAPTAPPALLALVQRLIATDRKARPRSADEVLDALSELPLRANVVRTLGRIVESARMAESSQSA